METFVFWKPEPEAWAVNAFSLSWKDIVFYAFPPFSVLGQVLTKIIEDQASGILVMPLWPTQPWFPVMLSPFDGSPSTYHARFEEPAAQGKTLSSASASQTVASFSDSFIRATLTDRGLSQQAKELLSNSWKGTKNSMTQLYEGGEHIVANRKLIPLLPL